MIKYNKSKLISGTIALGALTLFSSFSNYDELKLTSYTFDNNFCLQSISKYVENQHFKLDYAGCGRKLIRIIIDGKKQDKSEFNPLEKRVLSEGDLNFLKGSS